MKTYRVIPLKSETFHVTAPNKPRAQVSARRILGDERFILKEQHTA